ncbi:hypothetical protein ACLOJK_039727 [Asimina triloba]
MSPSVICPCLPCVPIHKSCLRPGIMGVVFSTGNVRIILAFLFLYLGSFPVCIATSILAPNDSIRVNQTVVSANGYFALGFFSPGNSSKHYLGIWYDKFHGHPVIWVANTESPLNDSSGILRFDSSGNLVILDGGGKIFWSTNISTLANISHAELLDSGNLVLMEADSNRELWQSFDHATNTFMPMMKLGVNLRTNKPRVITSWKSDSDPSAGSFSSGINSHILSQLFVWNGSIPHWRSGPWDGQVFLGIPEMNRRSYVNGFVIVREEELGTVDISYTYSNGSHNSTFVIDVSGKLEYLGWNENQAEWSLLWSAPDNECDFYNKCGPFGTCSGFKRPICRCLRGFEPKSIEEWSRGNWSSGCVRRRQLQCEINGTSSPQGNADTFLKLERIKPPDNVIWHPGWDVNNCKAECLNNCSCIAYSYDSRTECMLWGGSLIDIQEFETGGANLYIRLAASEMGREKELQERPSFEVGATGRTFFASSYANAKHAKLPELPIFDFTTLAVATNNFCAANKIGEGGFGSVYKGKLLDGQEIAVKRLSKSSDQGLEELKNEVLLISKLQHKNLVRLLGCCIEGEEKMLLYEFMPNKSLDAFLFDPNGQALLHWAKRFQIIEGIARGILYLHRDSRLKIIHRDLKASNVLLDDEMTPKISDFGMARILGGDEMLARTKRVVGT